MREYVLGDHPQLSLNFYSAAKFFSAGTKFPMPDLTEKIKGFEREKEKITVIGENHTKCSIATSDTVLLDKVQHILIN